MESKPCYKASCTQKAKFQCSCISSVTYMCQAHVNEHISIKRRNHNIQSISIIDPEIEEFALNILYEERSKIKQLQTESMKGFSQLFLSLENLLQSIFQSLDKNLNLLEQKITKIKVTEDISKFETDQLLRSLLFKDTAEAEKMCLVDASIIKNINAINRYAEKINENLKELNINNFDDIGKSNILGLVSQLFPEKIEHQQNQLTLELEKWENTIMSLNKDFKNYPKSRDSWYFKWGLTEFLAGNLYRALSLFNFAIKLNPKYSDCYFYKGLVLASINKKEESLECWNYLLQENKKFSFINIIKAKVLWCLEEEKECLKAYDEFIQNNPEYCFIYALNYIEKPNDLIVIKEGFNEKMVRLNPKFSWSYWIEGFFKIEKKKFEKALICFYRAIENDEHCFQSYNFIAAILYNEKIYEESLQNIKISIEINPYNASSYLCKAMILEFDERWIKCLKCVKIAYELDPTRFDGIYNNYGDKLFERGEYKKAIELYDLAIRIKPDCYDYKCNKDKALRKLEEIKDH